MRGLDLIGAIKAKPTTGLLGLGLGVLLAILWKKHRVLGFFGGALVGGGVGSLVSGDTAHGAILLAAGGAGIAGSLKWKAHPFWGYVLPVGVIEGGGVMLTKK